MDALTIIANPSPHQSAHAKALAAGLARHGIPTRICREHEGTKAPVVACWGWRIGERFRERGREVLVMERGYLGDRFRWTSLAWNGLNGRGAAPTIDDPARFAAHFGTLMEPVRRGGSYALLIGQVPGDMSLGGRNLSKWYEDQAMAAAATYRLPVRFRQHPVALQRGYKLHLRNASEIGGTLEAALADAAVVITFNSNTGVESLLAGIPTVAVDKGSMAWPVAARAIGDECRFAQRDEWAARLAWRQWTIEEIASGDAWEHVGAECVPAS